jgi:pyrroline-5-carboxylate reductase
MRHGRRSTVSRFKWPRSVATVFQGARELLASSDKSPGELRQLVTSPQGTTAAAVRVKQLAGSVVRPGAV